MGEGSDCHKGLYWAKDRAVTKACIGRRIGLSQRSVLGPVLGEGSGCHKGCYGRKNGLSQGLYWANDRAVTMCVYWAKDHAVTKACIERRIGLSQRP